MEWAQQFHYLLNFQWCTKLYVYDQILDSMQSQHDKHFALATILEEFHATVIFYIIFFIKHIHELLVIKKKTNSR